VPHLLPLLQPAKKATAELVRLRRLPITTVRPGDRAYVSLTFWKEPWYQSLGLPNSDVTDHVVLCTFGAYRDARQRFIRVYCDTLDEHLRDWDNGDVFLYGSRRDLSPYTTLVTTAFLRQYPQILSPHSRARWLTQHPHAMEEEEEGNVAPLRGV